ncbi:IS3 family transposase [Cupriavidus sp. WS]|uniref:IS3 family transposase n=1 Tax=Cupriavidus sp. WS TaxID=1312922 RepID=UPI0012DEDF3B|nr:IS3 family transposase [Cupriavidus sp. WS]
MGRRDFSDEFKADAVNLVLEQGYSVTNAAKALDIGETALRRWIGNRQAKPVPTTSDPTSLTPDQRRIRDLERQVARLERERDILKKFHGLLRQGTRSQYEVIEQAEKVWPVAVVCEILGMPRSTYYAWKARQAKPCAQREALMGQVQAIHETSGQSYGSRRMSQELRRRGHAVGRHRARGLMREAQVAVRKARKHYYSKGGKSSAIAPNRLNRQFAVAQPNRVWAGDVTFIWTQQGWLYLAVVMDLFSRRVVGWAYSNSADTRLVVRALRIALSSRQPAEGLMFHSDQGSPYASHAFQELLREEGITPSMSRAGNCWDNAVVERFFCSLKGERIRDRIYCDRAEAQADITNYVLFFYNQQRLHSAAMNMPPAEYENLKVEVARKVSKIT